MKALRLKPGQIVNPLYSAEARQEARQKNQPYEVPEFLTLPAGELVDEPDCWRLCIGAGAPLAPADDECKKQVLAVMGADKRKAFLSQLRRMAQPEVQRQLSKGDLAWLDTMLEIYDAELSADVLQTA